ncbi:MAG TPA: hypothetical protein VJL81_03790 [Solirubrobacterales bacterium]|nr:hypothetical protein [Solirubrobacterales bacterium]
MSDGSFYVTTATLKLFAEAWNVPVRPAGTGQGTVGERRKPRQRQLASFPFLGVAAAIAADL